MNFLNPKQAQPMVPQLTKCQNKTVNSLATLVQAILGEPVQISIDKPDPKGNVLFCIIEAETVQIRAEILGEGAVQNITIKDGTTITNSPQIDFGLGALFGIKQGRANPRSPLR
jgi:hypothetical protein